MRILITGATGLVGTELVRRLDNDFTIVSRSAQRAIDHFDGKIGRQSIIEWSPRSGPMPQPASEIDVVVNLMGESIGEGRWNVEKKKRIRDSRVLGTRNLVDSFSSWARPPKVLINSSAVGIYPDCGDEWIDETTRPGTGFLADVCTEWEQEANKASGLGARVVLLRTGIVLSEKGGALEKMLTPFRFGVGGKLATGKQWFPWIHLHDMVRLVEWAIDSESISGAVNASSPYPVTNKEFTQTLAKVLRRPAFFGVPEFALKIALGEFANALLASQRVSPEVAKSAGFDFDFPDLESALVDLVGNR
ncbi:MAG: TIGR01777 family oxidoreductase [Pirellulaceae bacterium]